MTTDHFYSIDWMNAVFEVEGLGTSAKLALLAIAKHADHEGRAYPGVGTLASLCGVSTRQLRNLTLKLEAAGFLSVLIGVGPYGTNVYQITGCYPQPRKPPSAPNGAGGRSARKSSASSPEIQSREPLKQPSANQVLINQETKARSISAQSCPGVADSAFAALAEQPLIASLAEHAPGTPVGAGPRRANSAAVGEAQRAPMSPETKAAIERLIGRPVSPKDPAN